MTQQAVQRFLADHAAFAANGASGGPGWLVAMRSAALARFAEEGFPTTRLEDWRFTSVQSLAETPFTIPHKPQDDPTAKQIHSFELCEAHRHLVVFVNGRFSAALSSVAGLPAGVRVGSLAETLRREPDLVERYIGSGVGAQGRPFAALNTAFLGDGGFVYVPANVQMDEPVQFLYLTVPTREPIVTHPRSLVVVERMGRASVVETYASMADGVHLTNAVTEIVVGDGARCECYRVQRESERAFHVATTHTRQGRDSRLQVHAIVFGAGLSRHDITVVMDGENGYSLLNGLYLMHGSQHVDHHTTIDHAKPHCESHEYFNGVLDGSSRGVFNGRIIVRPGAQRTDSKQTNNNLVLSESARADSQPQLEIYADDVKCTHGATLGPIDDKAVFYLKSRGISAAEARSLLTYGFGAEILDRIGIAPLQAQLERLVRARLLQGAEA